MELNPRLDKLSFDMGVLYAFAEMVARGLKPLALGIPLKPSELDEVLPLAEEIAAEHGVKVYAETSLLDTLLFDMQGRQVQVLILYRDPEVLEQYLELKHLEEQRSGGAEVDQVAIARRFGHLLGYSEDEIENMLELNLER